MPRPIIWSNDDKIKIRKMREHDNATAEEIGALFGTSKNAVINLLDRLNLSTGAEFRRQKSQHNHELQRIYLEKNEFNASREYRMQMGGEAPLPAGHSLSWNAISTELFHRYDMNIPTRNKNVKWTPRKKFDPRAIEYLRNRGF